MAKCKRIEVAADVCSIEFKKGVKKFGALDFDNKLVTARGEDMIFHVDQKGRVVEIELLGSKDARKPCQEESTTT